MLTIIVHDSPIIWESKFALLMARYYKKGNIPFTIIRHPGLSNFI
jgi:hypothetical protein